MCSVCVCVCACACACVLGVYVMCVHARVSFIFHNFELLLYMQLFSYIDRVAAGTCHGFAVGNFFLKTIVLTHCTIVEGTYSTHVIS